MKRLFLIISTIIFFLSTAVINSAQAEDLPSEGLRYARASASFKIEYAAAKDNRAEILQAYLEQYNSPFADKADVFVAEADKYNLDWKFVAAIAGIESTFGKRYPQGTYNAWGWGIYGDNMHYFTSWEDAIATISQGLRVRYMDQWGATNTYEIGSYYAASPTWAQRVEFFMNQMEQFEKEYENKQLSILI